jgi:hypothetical protein
MNFESGTKLAQFQDNLIEKLKQFENILFDEQILARLEGNMWVKSSKILAPSNLVIRQLCLIDILNEKPDNIIDICKLMSKLSPYHRGCKLWAEGYSYWEYTREILDIYSNKFKESYSVWKLKMDIETIDVSFIQTAYKKLNVLYPAPFGDLRKQPLAQRLQVRRDRPEDMVSGKFLKKAYNKYWINPYYCGGNTHTPSKNEIIEIKDGEAQGFKFYEGYDKKFSSRSEEMLNVGSRILKGLWK